MAQADARPTAWLRFMATPVWSTATTFAVQQAVVELSPSPAFGVRAGLMLLPLGIINRRTRSRRT